MLIAVEGCAHGDLERIYASLEHIERTQNVKIDLLLCCGDFQAVRNEDDLTCLACPAKYRSMNAFYKYYSGELRAPVPTIFIGGNHEASNHMWELYYGGWVCPNIYFLGYAGVVQFGGLRIGGLSGIYKDNHYRLGHFERPPYSDGDMRSAYHVRELDVFRLKQLVQPLDVFMSHDWPRGIAHFGDKAELFRRKPFLRSEVEDGSLGSAPAAELLQALQPRWWFSAHLHVKYAAAVRHGSGRITRFLALDKCLPRRDFIQVIDVGEARGPLAVAYDPEWLAVLRSTHHLLSFDRAHCRMPAPGGPARSDYRATAEEAAAVAARLAGLRGPSSEGAEGAEGGGALVPLNFSRDVPPFDPHARRGGRPPRPLSNPQMDALLRLLELPHVFAEDLATRLAGPPRGPPRFALPEPPPGGDPQQAWLARSVVKRPRVAAGGDGAALERALLEDDYGAADGGGGEGEGGGVPDDDDVRSEGDEGEGGAPEAGAAGAAGAAGCEDPNEIDLG